MRRLATAMALIAVFAVSGAQAKGPAVAGVRFCGESACRDVTERSAVQLLLPPTWNGAPRGPAVPGPYYSMRLLDERGRAIDPHSFDPPRLFYVPGTAALGMGSGIAQWRRLGPFAPDFRAATRGLRPFPRPRLSRVEVSGRPARDPISYLRLYTVRGRFADDPAGLHPQITGEHSQEALLSYYERVTRHWLPVNMWSKRPSPWGDGANFVWISRRGSLLSRDGEVIQIPASLAERVRRGLSLRAL